MVPTSSRLKSPAVSRGSFLALAGAVAGLGFAGVLSALPVAGAQAASTCPETTLTQPFLAKWKDANYYSLIAGGSFEAGETAWTLSGGAKVASGSETYAVTGTPGKSSLDLPAGATATSPLTCVEPTDRTFRFFDRSEGATATVTVKVVYESAAGSVAVVVGTLTPGSSWEPSPILHSGAAVAGAITGGVAHMSIRFSTTKGTARIDDVYLDPRMR
jgi:hypothetical protein